MEKPTAVVFDDDDLFRDLFARIFRGLDIQVDTYRHFAEYICSGPEIDACPVDGPCCDFLLTDKSMPDMTGLEFLKRTRRLGCKIPAERKAIISGHWSEEERAEASRLVEYVFPKNEAKKKICDWVKSIA
ncbi:MAG TPA: hypothetical protein VJ910_13830 [Desulfuromonadales bacterium]|nr:hypothetical protein [Desulfuromonadales bacterium]